MEYPLKEPGEKGPDGVAGGMGDAEEVGGDDELAGIFEADGGLKGEGVDDEGDGEGDPAGDPVGAFIERWVGWAHGRSLG